MADCLKIVDTANKGRLSEDQLDEILTELNAEKKARQAEGALGNIESAIFDRGLVMAKEAELAKKIEKRNRYMNILKEQKLMALVQRADEMTGDPSLGLEAALVGVNAPFEGAARSVDSVTNALVNSYAGGMIADLKKADLLTKFNNMKGDFERQVANVLGDLNLKTPAGVAEASADAVALGKILFKYQRAALQRENQAGSYIRLKEGRVVRASHDQRRMVKAGPDEWKGYIRDKLDYEKMGIAPERVDGFLDSAYEAIVSGVRKGGERTDISKAFTGPGNLAKKESASGVFTFKKPNDWYDYDQKFGKASLRESFMQDMQSASRATALMEVLGSNPEAMVNRVIKRMEDKYRGDAKKLKRIKRESAVITFKAALDEVTGDVNIGSHTPLARYMHFYRSIQTMAKLGGAWISALSDIAFIASNRVYQGRSLMDAWGDGLTAVFKGMNKGEMRDFSDRLAVGIEGQLGDFMSRFNAADDVPGQTSKMMSAFFKLNLLQPWTESNKRGVTLMIANDLGREAGKRFDKVPEDLRRILGMYGIDQKGWDLARKGAKKGPDGRTYLVPGEIPDVKIRENVFALLVSEADNSVPSPGARERAVIRRGYRPGTAAGEGIRFLTQFKSFGVTALTKSVGRQVYGYGAKTPIEQFQRGIGANMGIVNSIVGTTVLGYYVMQLKEIAKGREMRPASVETFIAAAMQGGGLGIYGDFLFGEANRYGGGTLQTLAGPGIGTASELVDLLQRARGVVTGGDEDLRGDAVRLLKGNIPFANLFYTKEAMNYLVWYQLQESINPGYLRRMERRAKTQNDQTYWLPPSSIVQTGGGFR
tara:strand:- start:69 stop:2534 length:2466 start_codon:yes stop_codon:yes gene_type:complete